MCVEFISGIKVRTYDSNRKVLYMLLRVFHICSTYVDILFLSCLSFFITRRYIWCSNAFPMWVSLEKASRVEGSDAKCAFSDASARCQRRWIYQLPWQCRLQVSHVVSQTTTCWQSEWTSQMLIFLRTGIPRNWMFWFRFHLQQWIFSYHWESTWGIKLEIKFFFSSCLPLLKRTSSLESFVYELLAMTLQ